MAANARRGEIEATLAGRTCRLCLTLGALAELETAFGVEDLAALGRRFGEGRLSTGDLLRLLVAGLRGGGDPLGEDELRALPAEALPAVTAAVAELLTVTFGAPAPNPR